MRMSNFLNVRHCQSIVKASRWSIVPAQHRSITILTTVVASNPMGMNKTEEPSLNNEANQSADGATRSITDRLPMGPIVAAGRLMSCLSKQSRSITSKRAYTVSGTGNEKSSFLTPLSTQISSSRFRSSSSQSPPSTRSTSCSGSSCNKESSPPMHNSKTTPSDLNKISKTSTTPTMPTPDTVGHEFNFNSTYTQLRDLADTNCTYFSRQKTDVCRRFERLLIQLKHTLDLSVPLIRYLTDNFHHFDYSPEIKAHGYRSLVVAHGQACVGTLDILQQVDTKRVGLLFNLMYSSRLFQDLESWTKALIAMQHILTLAVNMVDYSEKKVLYVDANHVPLDIELDYFKMVAFDSEYFFGRTCGFQFAPSMQKMLTFLLAGLATFHETYNRSIPYAAASLATAPKYILFPEQRAKKCAAIFRDSDYLFCKSFWNIVDHDYVKMGSRYIVPSVTVSKYFQIGPEEIEINSIIIPPPTACAAPDEPNECAAGNIGNGSDNATGSGTKQPKQLVNLKLLSHEVREGMNELPLKKNDFEISSMEILPMSDHLLLHIHGGGFIATSTTTHEVYLKPWALGLEIPIVSIDYSLAPESPYPRAIEECFYAYAWVLKNANKLGWNGKTLLLAGDSAGGNLVTIVTMKSIEVGLRKPDAIICFYTPFLLGYSMSPSRLMAIMDPLLNTGFLWRCLAAYAGIKSSDDEFETVTIPNLDDTTAEKQQKLNNVTSSPGQTVPQSDNNSSPEQVPNRAEYIRGDSYYSRLGDIMGSRQAYLLRKLRESTLPNNPYMSPLRASDDTLRQFPTTYLVACHQDPLLDDSITFARHLRSLSVEHHLVIVQNLTHGFLSFYNANTDCKRTADLIMNDLARRYNIDGPLFPSSSSTKKKKRNKKNVLAPLTNPIFPLTRTTTTTTDIIHPFIDDNVEFARRLRDLNVPHHLNVVDEFPHGFLDFGFAATNVAQYNIEIINMMLNILKQSESIHTD
ncbi:unnamed protein product [Rotaria socialis]|uniref:Hormone-sensitive lipase n=1 Tax=Rotaria socialis TaxID=392032 RepID=A0A818G6W5_9BILA|nr:unnamed protein product [Rotaria socialis]